MENLREDWNLLQNYGATWIPNDSPLGGTPRVSKTPKTLIPPVLHGKQAIHTHSWRQTNHAHGPESSLWFDPALDERGRDHWALKMGIGSSQVNSWRRKIRFGWQRDFILLCMAAQWLWDLSKNLKTAYDIGLNYNDFLPTYFDPTVGLHVFRDCRSRWARPRSSELRVRPHPCPSLLGERDGVEGNIKLRWDRKRCTIMEWWSMNKVCRLPRLSGACHNQNSLEEKEAYNHLEEREYGNFPNYTREFLPFSVSIVIIPLREGLSYKSFRIREKMEWFWWIRLMHWL